MKYQFAMLADAALMGPNNKLIINGATIDNVQAAAYPAVHPALSLVGSFELEDQDYGKIHRIWVEGETPQREPWFPRIETTITSGPHTASYPEKSVFIINFAMLVFPTSGEYRFRLYVDGQRIQDLPLHAIIVPPPAAEVSKSVRPKARRDTIGKEQDTR